MTRDKGPPLVARVSRLKMLGYLAIGAALTAGAVGMVRDGGIALLIGAPCAAICGGATLWVIRQMLRTGPVMEIGPEGILWRRWSDSAIPWSAFSRAWVTGHMVSLWLKDPDAYRSNGVLGRLSPLNKAGGYGDIILLAQGLDCSFDEMADAVYRHRPSLFRR